MTFSFSKSLLCSLLLLCWGTRMLAQAPATPAPGATPDPKEHKPKDGYLRFWNMLPQDAGDLSILRETGTPEPEAIASAAVGNTYAGYLSVKPGRYALRVVRAADPKTTLKTFDVLLRAGVFITFIARVVDGQLNIEMLDDTYDRENTVQGRLVVRHELPGAVISVDAPPRAATGLSYGQVEKLEGFPVKPVMVKMNAVLANGQKRDWTMEVNFAVCRHVTLLLALDPYGRFRPRISPEGQREYDETPLAP